MSKVTKVDVVRVGARSRTTVWDIEYDCGHKARKTASKGNLHLCPDCRKRIWKSREKHNRSLPFYLKGD